MAGVVASGLACALLVGGALVAGIGWVDDRRGVSPVLRAIVHILAASVAVVSLGGYPSLALGSYVVDLGLLGGVAAVLAIAYLVNVYNFMDGTDGLAGAEGGQVAAAGALLSLGFGGLDLALVAALISGSCFGFLLWNWPPARIFMGDVGSGLLGYWFGVLAIASEGRGVPSVVWILLLGVFLVDGTLTLARRVLRGERWYEAHRSHLYQRAAAVKGHRAVVWAAIVANVLFAMLAWLSVARTDANLLVVLSLTGMLIGYWVLARRYPLRTDG